MSKYASVVDLQGEWHIQDSGSLYYGEAIVNELNRQAETIANMNQCLNLIGAELGIQPIGDGTDATLIDRVLGAIREIQRDAERYRFVRCRELGESGAFSSLYDEEYMWKYGLELDDAIDKALAAGEAGNASD